MPAAGRESRSWPAHLVALVGAITLVGLALRLPSFGSSLHSDELSTYFVVHGFGLGGVLDLVRGTQEGTPPLYYLLASLMKDVGDRAEGLRLVPILAGVAAIPLTYLLGTWTVGRPAAAVGAGLIALSPFLIFYSTEARGYSLATVLALLSALAMLRALDAGRTVWWAAYAVCAAGAIYSHYTAVFVLIGQFAWSFLARPESRRILVVATAGAAVLYLPWLPSFLDDRDQPAAHIIEAAHPFALGTAWGDSLNWLIGLPYERPELLPPSSLTVGLILAGIAIGSVGLLLALRARGRPSWWPPPDRVLLVVVLAAATPVGAAVYSLFAPSVFLPRNLIASWPGLALALAALVVSGRGLLRIAAVALLLGGFAIPAVKMLDSDQQRPDYEGAVEFIQGEADPGDPVVEVPQPSPGPQTALEAELAPNGEARPERNPALTIGLGSLEDRLRSRAPGGAGPLARLPVPSAQGLARRAARLARGGRLFLVASGTYSVEELRANPQHPAGEFLLALPARFRPVDSRSFPGLSFYEITVHVLEDSGP